MTMRTLGVAAATAIVLAAGCGGDDGGGDDASRGSADTGVSGSTGSQERPAEDELRSCVTKAGYTLTVAGSTNPFTPDAPPPLFEATSSESRFVFMRADGLRAAERAERALLARGGTGDGGVVRKGLHIIASQETRPPGKLVDCLP